MKKETKLIEKGGELQVVYIGIDVHKKQWKVAIYTPLYEYKVFSQNPDPGQLYVFLCKHFPGWRYLSVYEAGFCGFWIDASLSALGIENMVINPADLPESQKDRRRKTDTGDARKLAKALRGGFLKGIYCPSSSFQSLRSMVRHRSKLVKSQTIWKNRIKSYLSLHGVFISPCWQERNWSGHFLRWLYALPFGDQIQRATLASMLDTLRGIREEITRVNRRLRHLSKEAEHQPILACLTSVPGIGLISAWIIYTELMDLSRFASRDHLHSYCGLVPDLNQSGERDKGSGITRRSNRYLRAILVEASWQAIRRDPALQTYYQEQLSRMKAQQAIIRVAKKLVNRIRKCWVDQVPYQINTPAPEATTTPAGIEPESA